jgi:hypothetical protein
MSAARTGTRCIDLLAGIPKEMSYIEAYRAFAADAESAAFFYRDDDPTSLAASLDALLDDPDALANARQTAFRLGQERFNWDCESAALVALIERGTSETQ